MLRDYPGYVRALAMVKKAAARANRDARVLDSRRLRALERSCDVLIRGEYLDEFPVDVLGGGGGVAVNMNINEVVANLANEFLGRARGAYEPIDPKAHVNASQSTATSVIRRFGLRSSKAGPLCAGSSIIASPRAAPRRGSFARYSRWRVPACRTRSRFPSASSSAATARRCSAGFVNSTARCGRSDASILAAP